MMRRTATASVAAAVVLALAGCSSSTSTPSAAPTTHPASVASTATPADVPSSSAPAVPTETCATPLPDRGDIIVREKFPNVPIDALELGGTDPEHCIWTMDSLKKSQPSGPGFCSEVAWASDNPGYDPNAVPAPPLKKVQETIGDCG